MSRTAIKLDDQKVENLPDNSAAYSPVTALCTFLFLKLKNLNSKDLMTW